MNEGPYPFVAKVISDDREEAGIESAALQIRKFFTVREEGADSEIAWLESYFGSSGMESMSDTDLIKMMIERELLANSDEQFQCSECGRIFVESSSRGKITRYKVEPFDLTQAMEKETLSAYEAATQEAMAQQVVDPNA